MEDFQIDRINELARKAKETALTDEEKEEQDMLRQAYVAAVRQNFHNTMNTITIEYPDGTRKKPVPRDTE